MIKSTVVICLLVAALVGTMFAAEGGVPTGMRHLDHVFVIMMENHAYGQIVGNPDAPFANQYLKSANTATNYFAIGHPSLTNYLESVGGSNFGVRSDNSPDWHNATCTTNLVSGTPVTDNPSSPAVCPIAGSGTDAETPPVDLTNECPSTSPCPPGLIDINGVLSVPAAANTVGKSIADQLAERNITWKTYQESLPPTGATRSTTATDSLPTARTSRRLFPARSKLSSSCMLPSTTHSFISAASRKGRTQTQHSRT